MAADEEDETGRVRRPSGKRVAKQSGDAEADSRADDAGGKPAKGRVTAAHAMRYAVEQLQELLGRAPESVSTVKPTDEGWEAAVEVLELERVPSTTSVLASYRVTLDEEGELVSYERVRRYTRGQIDPRM
ncbi:gas vesicle protein [Streptomyces sp. NPDC059080]|uniref:gas vesicle protein GvpO n=1 Tax=Streptomyces sp. NPDC059080 TaxID=3346718 RepID=UPI0036C23F61